MCVCGDDNDGDGDKEEEIGVDGVGDEWGQARITSNDIRSAHAPVTMTGVCDAPVTHTCIHTYIHIHTHADTQTDSDTRIYKQICKHV